jgi:MFS family permease
MSKPQTAYWSAEAQAKRLRWNYVVMILDGASWMAGMAFMTSETLMPNMIRDLGGSDWMVALAPGLLLLGTMSTPLLMVHHVEQLREYKPYTFRVSLAQRFIPLLAALGLLLFWDRAPGLCLLLAAFNQLLIGLIGGLSSPAFWQLYSKIIPANRRSSNSAWRNSVGVLVGIGSGATIAGVLAAHPGRTGYAILLLLQSSLLLLSGVFFALIRELPDPPHEARPHRGPLDVLRSIPAMLTGNGDFKRYLAFRALGQAHVILVPFMAISFRARLGLPEVFLGYFVQAQMFGGVAGNLMAGVWGDRAGSHKPLAAARLSGIVLCAAAPFIAGPAPAIASFFLLGLLINVNNTSENMLLLELSSPEQRPSLIAMQSIILVPTLLAFGLLSRWLHQFSGNLVAEAVAAGLLLTLSHLTLMRLRNPRRSPAATS